MAIMRELNELLELLSFNSQIIKEAVSIYNSLVKNIKTALNVDKFVKPVPQSQKGQDEKQSQVGKQGQTNVINFSKDKNLSKLFSYGGVPIKFQATVSSEDIQNKIANLQKIIDNGTLYSYLSQIKHFIEVGAIDGYSDEKWQHLKPVFNNIKGNKTIFDTDVKKIMAIINDMVGLLSFNSKIIKEVAKNKTLDWIVNILKKIWNIDKFITKNPEEKSPDNVANPNEKEQIKKNIDSLKKAV
jgi:hypothetical protein